RVDRATRPAGRRVRQVVVARDDGADLGVVEQLHLDRARRHVRAEVLTVGEVPERRGDVVDARPRVAERGTIQVDLRRRGVLHRLAHARAELPLDHRLELDRIEPDAAYGVRERTL